MSAASDGGGPAPLPHDVFTLPNTPGGSETVLVVENEDPVRDMIRAILELAGYRVLDAANAGEALEIVGRGNVHIDLLLTDLDMPDMNGRELAQRVRSERPEIRLLYTSGRAHDEIIGYGVLPLGTLFLMKPFTAYGLTWRVREILDA